jgi:2,3-dihydroxyphenylpropionate 1,2-dioxygenase
MPLAFAAAAVHAPGITGRAQNATEQQRGVFFPAYRRLRERLEAARLDALVMVSAEHFTNFFMDNMPAFCFGLAEDYPGPSEDEPFLKIPKTRVPGAARLARDLATAVSEDVDIAHSEELVLDHGFMVPLHLLTPDMQMPIVPVVVNCLAAPRPALKRCYALGRALRRAIDTRAERIGLLACGGLSHWPAVPESGKLNVEWDRGFLEDFLAHRRDALTRYTEADIERDAGPGGHEVRAWIVVSAATEGARGETLCFEPIPAYAITGAIATMAV